MLDNLERCEENDDSVNGMIIASLLDLEAVEAAPVIKRAFAVDKVDEMMVGDWDWVQYDLGLTDKPPKPRRSKFAGLGTGVFDFGPLGDRKTRCDLKAKRKAQRQAKKKNRKKKR